MDDIGIGAWDLHLVNIKGSGSGSGGGGLDWDIPSCNIISVIVD